MKVQVMSMFEAEISSFGRTCGMNEQADSMSDEKDSSLGRRLGI